MKVLGVLLLVIVIIVGGLAIGKNTIANMAVSKTIRRLTGLEVSIQSMKIGLLNTLIDVTGIRIDNPEGYPDKIMAELPVIYVDYNLGALIKGKVDLPELRLHLKEFNIIKNKDGKLNISSIKVVKEQKEEVPEKEKAAAKTKTPPIAIGSFQLKIGRVVYKDYSQGTPPTVREFNLNLDETYRDITDFKALVNIIIVKALRKTAIDRLANFDLDILTDRLPPGLKESTQLVTKSAAGVKKLAEESVGAAKNAIEDAAGILKGAFSSPAAEEGEE